MSRAAGRSIPRASVGRLPLYLRALADAVATGTATMSSSEIARRAGVSPDQVRRDLSSLGQLGTRGVGYDVASLLEEVRRALDLVRERRVVIVGVGNLGHALARYRGFPERGFRPVALVDADPRTVGEEIDGLRVRPMRELGRVVRDAGIDLGVICVPAAEAQRVTDALVGAGVRSILNFAPVEVEVPRGVTVRRVDLAIELQLLTYYGTRARPARARGAGAGGSATSRS